MLKLFKLKQIEYPLEEKNVCKSGLKTKNFKMLTSNYES